MSFFVFFMNAVTFVLTFGRFAFETTNSVYGSRLPWLSKQCQAFVDIRSYGKSDFRENSAWTSVDLWHKCCWKKLFYCSFLMNTMGCFFLFCRESCHAYFLDRRNINMIVKCNVPNNITWWMTKTRFYCGTATDLLVRAFDFYSNISPQLLLPLTSFLGGTEASLPGWYFLVIERGRKPQWICHDPLSAMYWMWANRLFWRDTWSLQCQIHTQSLPKHESPRLRLIACGRILSLISRESGRSSYLFALNVTRVWEAHGVCFTWKQNYDSPEISVWINLNSDRAWENRHQEEFSFSIKIPDRVHSTCHEILRLFGKLDDTANFIDLVAFLLAL